jgi:hypothetical protein
MAEEKKKYNDYHLNVQMSRTFFSYKKPGDGGAYALMYVTYYNGMISLHFKRGITSENVLDLNCYLNDGKAYDLSRLLEGIMGRRREAYAAGKNYQSDEVYKIPTSSFREGQEVATGYLMIDTEMYDGIPRLRLSYHDIEKNDTIEVVFNSRVPSGEIEASTGLDFKIDYADIEAYEFVTTFKELQDPLIPMIYKIQDSAVSAITKYFSACFKNFGSGNRPSNGGGYNNSPSFGGDDEYGESPF